MTVFPDWAAHCYGTRCASRVPGYLTTLELTNALAARLVAPKSLFLVSGCGTGNDLLSLLETEPSWTFTATEPSEGMIGKARERVAEKGFLDRVTFLQIPTEKASRETKHKGASSILVSQFFKGEAKLSYLTAIGNLLEPGSPLLTLDYYLGYDKEEMELREAYLEWLRARGFSQGEARGVILKIDKEWGPVTYREKEGVLRKAGFRDVTIYAQNLNYMALLSYKA